MPKILVIEDTENNRIIISRRLKAMKHEVHLCEDAEQGIVAAQELQPHLILMDIGLPGMDGWAATRALRTNPATATIPIIALTAHIPAINASAQAQFSSNSIKLSPPNTSRPSPGPEMNLVARCNGSHKTPPIAPPPCMRIAGSLPDSPFWMT
ncbi:MAG: response regulator [Verrucomicrobia bacterium]|nr:response regulator [Verrucomicrobiota bacterium]